MGSFSRKPFGLFELQGFRDHALHGLTWCSYPVDSMVSMEAAFGCPHAFPCLSAMYQQDVQHGTPQRLGGWAGRGLAVQQVVSSGRQHPAGRFGVGGWCLPSFGWRG